MGPTPAQKSHGGLGPDFFKGPSWGYGQSVLDSGAYGWDGGFGTTWLVDPTCDLTVIVLTQRMFETSEDQGCTVTSRRRHMRRSAERRIWENSRL